MVAMTVAQPCSSRLEDCRCAGDHPAHHTHRCAVPGVCGPIVMDIEALPDLGDISLSELLDDDSPILADVMRRIAAEDDEAQGIVAGFQSAI